MILSIYFFIYDIRPKLHLGRQKNCHVTAIPLITFYTRWLHLPSLGDVKCKKSSLARVCPVRTVTIVELELFVVKDLKSSGYFSVHWAWSLVKTIAFFVFRVPFVSPAWDDTEDEYLNWSWVNFWRKLHYNFLFSGPGVPAPLDDPMAASLSPSPPVEPSKPSSKLSCGPCVDYFCACNTTRFRWYELEGKGTYSTSRQGLNVSWALMNSPGFKKLP